jgi:hypothetical protein
MTEKEIEAGKSPAGGFTRKQLAKWGVPWPPPRGWKEKLLRGEPVKQIPHWQKRSRAKRKKDFSQEEAERRDMEALYRSKV